MPPSFYLFQYSVRVNAVRGADVRRWPRLHENSRQAYSKKLAPQAPVSHQRRYRTAYAAVQRGRPPLPDAPPAPPPPPALPPPHPPQKTDPSRIRARAQPGPRPAPPAGGAGPAPPAGGPFS